MTRPKRDDHLAESSIQGTVATACKSLRQRKGLPPLTIDIKAIEEKDKNDEMLSKDLEKAIKGEEEKYERLLAVKKRLAVLEIRSKPRKAELYEDLQIAKDNKDINLKRKRKVLYEKLTRDSLPGTFSSLKDIDKKFPSKYKEEITDEEDYSMDPKLAENIKNKVFRFDDIEYKDEYSIPKPNITSVSAVPVRSDPRAQVKITRV